jgi:hypothetical protein
MQSKKTMQHRLERGGKYRYANGLGILQLDRKRCELKTERRKDQKQTNNADRIRTARLAGLITLGASTMP